MSPIPIQHPWKSQRLFLCVERLAVADDGVATVDDDTAPDQGKRDQVVPVKTFLVMPLMPLGSDQVKFM